MEGLTGKPEGRQSKLCAAVGLRLYGVVKNDGFRSLLRRFILRFEGGPMYSLTVRRIYSKFHGLDVGLYTIGPCESGPDGIDPGTSIGRYSSIYYTVRVLVDGYPPAALVPAELSVHSDSEHRENNRRVDIGNDVFIGHNAIILPSVESIGDGAFIGAGSVVKNSVPPYGIVMGNPARVVRYRFSAETIGKLLEEKWWLKSLDELGDELEEFRNPLEQADSQ